MWEKLRGKVKGSARFPKRSTGDLNSLENFWFVFGLIWIFLGILADLDGHPRGLSSLAWE